MSRQRTPPVSIITQGILPSAKQEYTAGFLINIAHGQVALIRKLRPAWQRGKLNGIGGKVNPRETPHDAQVREFQEETGRAIRDWRLFARMEAESYRVHFYSSFTDQQLGDILGSPTDEKVVICDYSELNPHKCVANVRWLVLLAIDVRLDPQLAWLSFLENLLP